MTPPSRHVRLLPPLGLVLLLAGCGGNENTLTARSDAQAKITQIFWVVFGFSAFGFGVVVFLLFLGWWRRSKSTLPFGGGERAATGLVIGAGVALPIVLLVALFVYADLFAMNATSAPPKGSTELTIDVTGHQFWWDVAYRGTTAVTANEIHVPVHTRVAIVTHTADVIHSFWIPELNRKMDMIPGQENRVLIDANTPGVYAGHCAEFCGLQHAHMVVLVVAQPRAAFDRWLARESKPAAESTSRGAQLFQHLACASCHQIRGTAAHGRVGPDLTHFASRTTLGAVRLTNNAHNVARWLRDPQAVKPGNKMPDLALPDSDWVALERYMESLR